MASLRGVSRSARALQPFSTTQFASIRRCASTQAPGSGSGAGPAATTPSSKNIPDLAELETNSALETPLPSAEDKKEFRPWKRAADRKARLPSSRYVCLLTYIFLLSPYPTTPIFKLLQDS